MSVGEPEQMSLNEHCEPCPRVEACNNSDVVNVLERNEIRIPIELVVGREQVLKGVMGSIGGIIISASVTIFEGDTRSRGNVGELIPDICSERERPVFQ